jgi:hypothetical protein
LSDILKAATANLYDTQTIDALASRLESNRAIFCAEDVDIRTSMTHSNHSGRPQLLAVDIFSASAARS